VWLDVAARTAQEAASALGVAVGQIAKSVVFRRLADDAHVLVVASGDRRVDEAKVAALVGPVGRADAAFVKARSGFAIGGVAPLAHAQPPVALLDQELLRFAVVWAAAGHPQGVFAASPQQLLALCGGPLANVALLP
jgi:prolyl-tRNA editing enzyme YbaK/EbsC (Cys-tRNA(Pro) deacylase)